MYSNLLLLRFSYVQMLVLLLSNTFNVCVWNWISHPYITTYKIVVQYISVFTFLVADRMIEDSEVNGSKHSQNAFILYMLVNSVLASLLFRTG
jgi:hypothetical protein